MPGGREEERVAAIWRAGGGRWRVEGGGWKVEGGRDGVWKEGRKEGRKGKEGKEGKEGKGKERKGRNPQGEAGKERRMGNGRDSLSDPQEGKEPSLVVTKLLLPSSNSGG